MQKHSHLIEQHGGFAVWQIGEDRLEELTRFVFSVYFTHFADGAWQPESAADFQKMLSDDKALAHRSTVFAAISNQGTLLSTGRAIERRRDPLPMERDFGISPQVFAKALPPGVAMHRVFEVARLATDGAAILSEGMAKSSIPQVTDAVVRQIVDCTCGEQGNLWVASMDVRALALFRSRGFEFVDIGQTNPAYLGSPTTPVALSIDHCREQFRLHRQPAFVHYFAHNPVAQVLRPAAPAVHGPSWGDLANPVTSFAAAVA